LAAVVVGDGGGDVASHYGDGRDVDAWCFRTFRKVERKELTAELRGTVALIVHQGVGDVGTGFSSSDAFQRGILDECEFLLVAGSKWRVVFLP
jgi:hypothetical protein